MGLRREASRAFCLLTTLLFVLASGTTCHGQLTAEKAATILGLYDVSFSPDGQRVAFTARRLGVEGFLYGIHVLDLQTQREEMSTPPTLLEYSPRWSPDGQELAFIRYEQKSDQDKEKLHCIYITSLGGQAERLTQEHDVQSLEWSPDGSLIAFIAKEPLTEEEEKRNNDKGGTRIVGITDKPFTLWVINVKTKQIDRLTGPGWAVQEVQWVSQRDKANYSPQLFLIASEAFRHDKWEEVILSISIPNPEQRELARWTGPVRYLRTSPDGQWITFLASDKGGPEPRDIHLLSAQGGRVRSLSRRLDRQILNYTWRDNQSLLALVARGFTGELREIRLDGDSQPIQNFSGHAVADYSDSYLAYNKNRLVYINATASQPQELWLWNENGDLRQLTFLHKDWLPISLRALSPFWYRSFDGMKIQGALLMPASCASAKNLPVVVLIHGGPSGRWKDEFEPWGQLLAGSGYAVFYPNIRGSNGYGQRFLEMNRYDWGGADYKDVVGGINYLINRGIVDRNRIGIGGWSYGGYMAAWAITHTRLFKAAVVGAGVSNLLSEYGTGDVSLYDEWYLGIPYNHKALRRYIGRSPVVHVRQGLPPTLILQGQEDEGDPIGQSDELYQALKRYKVDSQYVIYPREGHTLSEFSHVVDSYNQVVAWFSQHLGSPCAHH